MFEADRIGIVGGSGTGKTTVQNQIMRPHRRVVLFDAEDERAKTAFKEGFTEINSFDELQDKVDANYAAGFRYWFKQEDHIDQIQALSDLSLYLMDIQAQAGKLYGTDKRPKILLSVDEMAESAPNHALKKDQQEFFNLCRRGRKKGIDLIGATQRPAEVSTSFRGQLKKVFFFNFTAANDLKAVRDWGGDEDGAWLANEVRKLKTLEYIKMHETRFYRGKASFA